MARSTNNKKSGPKSGASTLRPLSDAEVPLPASRIEGRKLLPVPFTPERGQSDEIDGVALTRVGRRFREVFAEEQGVDPAEVDLGIVRQVEALSADTDRNMAALSAVQSKRTEHGTLRYVRMTVNTPLLFPWLLNGRALRRMGGQLRGSAHIVTTAEDHTDFRLPIMRVESADAVVEIVDAQRRLLGLANYTSADGTKKDRIDSIVQFGVLDPPDVVLTQLISPDGSAWTAQAAEGAQRLFSALLAMEVLAGRNVASVATDRWLRSDPARLRDLSPEDLVTLPDALRFGASAAAGYFPGSDLEAWVESIADTTPAAVAFQLLRTMEVNLIIAVNPDEVVTRGMRHPYSDTIQELIRSFHMPGKSKDPWNQADVHGMIAIGAIDELASDSRIDAKERADWLGEELPAWNGPSVDDAGKPANLLVSVTKLIASLTTQGALEPTPESSEDCDSLELVNRHLRVNNTWVSPDNRAKVAAAQAIAALAMHQDAWESTLQAAIFGTFRHAWFWKTSDHGSKVLWPEMLGMPLRDLADRAREERAKNVDLDDLDAAGPAQRALAALGGMALMANPGLIGNGEALSRTGLGGGGQRGMQVSATDPSMLLRKMVQFEAGIDELEDAIAALVVQPNPTVPIDREEHVELTDLYLRNRWLGANRTTVENPHTEFARRVQELVELIKGNRDTADELAGMLAGELLGLERPDPSTGAENAEDYAPDLWTFPVYEEIGINEVVADETIPVLQELVSFFQVGKAYARAASRTAR